MYLHLGALHTRTRCFPFFDFFTFLSLRWLSVENSLRSGKDRARSAFRLNDKYSLGADRVFAGNAIALIKKVIRRNSVRVARLRTSCSSFCHRAHRSMKQGYELNSAAAAAKNSNFKLFRFRFLCKYTKKKNVGIDCKYTKRSVACAERARRQHSVHETLQSTDLPALK